MIKVPIGFVKKNVEAPLQGLDTLILHPLFYWEYVAIREEKEGKGRLNRTSVVSGTLQGLSIN